MEISIKEARANFSSIISQAEGGKEIIIRRRGKEVARLVPPRGREKRLPTLKKFRGSISIKGKSLSAEVLRMREEERY
jgi:prevent-host-death family protein